MNRMIVDGIRTRLDKASEACADELDAILWAYKTSPKVVTGESPFNLVYGSTIMIPVEVKVKTHRIVNYDKVQNAELRKENLDMLAEEREMARLKSVSIIRARCALHTTNE